MLPININNPTQVSQTLARGKDFPLYMRLKDSRHIGLARKADGSIAHGVLYPVNQGSERMGEIAGVFYGGYPIAAREQQNPDTPASLYGYTLDDLNYTAGEVKTKVAEAYVNQWERLIRAKIGAAKVLQGNTPTLATGGRVVNRIGCIVPIDTVHALVVYEETGGASNNGTYCAIVKINNGVLEVKATTILSTRTDTCNWNVAGVLISATNIALAYYGPSGYDVVRVATVNVTAYTISLGTEVQTTTTVPTANYRVLVKVNTDAFATSSFANVSSTYRTRVRAWTVTGNTATGGTELDPDGDNRYNCGLSYISAGKLLAMWNRGTTGGSYTSSGDGLAARVLNISGNTITAAATTVVLGGSATGMHEQYRAFIPLSGLLYAMVSTSGNYQNNGSYPSGAVFRINADDTITAVSSINTYQSIEARAVTYTQVGNRKYVKVYDTYRVGTYTINCDTGAIEAYTIVDTFAAASSITPSAIAFIGNNVITMHNKSALDAFAQYSLFGNVNITLAVSDSATKAFTAVGHEYSPVDINLNIAQPRMYMTITNSDATPSIIKVDDLLMLAS